MNAKTKILIVEHDVNDIELMLYELRKGEIDFESEIVQNQDDYIESIKNFVPDVILSDYSLPAFNGVRAFEIRETICPHIPFIFVSGTIGEENSIELIKNGLTDYVIKDKLFTLASKIKRALKEANEKQKRDKAEQERIETGRRLARAQQLAHMGSWELDFATGVVQFSDEACRIYGIPIKECSQTFDTWLSFIHSEDLDFLLKEVNRARELDQDSFIYHRIVLKNGLVKHIYSESKVEFDSTGKATGNYGIVHDITEKKIAEEQKEFDRNNLESLINNTKDLMWSVDKNFNLITSNQPFDEIVLLISGKTIEKGSSVLNFGFSPEHLARYKKYYERAFTGETFTEIEYTNTPYEFWSEISFYPICHESEIIGTACFSRDVTRRKLAEMAFTKISDDLTQRNKELEQFIYIVSHNLRAPVANILGYSDILTGKLYSDKEKDDIINGISTSITKLDAVIMDLNEILKIKDHLNNQKEKILFSEIINKIETNADHVYQKHFIKINHNFSEINEILNIKNYFQNIFYQLIANSIKFRRPGIPLVINIKSCNRLDNKFELIFEDNGMGIDLKKNKEKIFGLYMRFHPQIEGKGMSLFMIKSQIESIGGSIKVNSKVNEGTKFTIELEK